MEKIDSSKIGNKYVIEIDDEYINTSDTDTLYHVKGFKSLVLNKFELSKLLPLDTFLDNTYDAGYNEGLKAVNKIQENC